MKDTIIVKMNGKIWRVQENSKRIESNEFSSNIHESNDHLCFDCENCYADRCPKVSDEVKKPLGRYNFISEGVQVYDDNGDTKYFFVSKCDNFEKDKVRKKLTTKEELEGLQRLKESIKVAYFDAIDIDEADKTHYDLIKRKQILYGVYNNSTFRRK